MSFADGVYLVLISLMIYFIVQPTFSLYFSLKKKHKALYKELNARLAKRIINTDYLLANYDGQTKSFYRKASDTFISIQDELYGLKKAFSIKNLKENTITLDELIKRFDKLALDMEDVKRKEEEVLKFMADMNYQLSESEVDESLKENIQKKYDLLKGCIEFDALQAFDYMNKFDKKIFNNLTRKRW